MKHLSKILALLSLCFCFASSAIAATSSIVMDMETGKILTSSNADEKRYPASLTKMMTLYIAFTALENGTLNLDDKLLVSRTAANRSPSRLGLKPGETIKVEDVIKALIVKSANDCATVMAEGIGGSEEKFAEAMTTIAKELGMKNTTFKNASGLPNKAQKTTARDMAILSAAIYQHFPQYYEMFSMKSFSYNGLTHKTHNRTLARFSEADGLKTGYTAAAGYNIATSAKRQGKRVIAVTMGHKTQKTRDDNVIVMMDKSLNKLAGIKDKKTLLAEIDLTIKPDYEQVQIAQAEIIAEEAISENSVNDSSNDWAVKIGSFSNYAKAKNYAKIIKVQKAKEIAGKTIKVEAESIDSAIVYIPQIAGFSQEAANDFCNDLKKSNKSCMVIENKNLYLAYKK